MGNTKEKVILGLFTVLLLSEISIVTVKAESEFNKVTKCELKFIDEKDNRDKKCEFNFEYDEERLDKADGEIIIPFNGTTTIKLREYKAAGIAWHLTIENEGIVQLVSDEYKFDIHELLGVGGFHSWTLKGIKEGTTKIKFQLYQDWNPKKIYVEKEYTTIVEK